MAENLPLRQNEELLRSLHLRTILSRRDELVPSQWSYSLRDPFWRLYVNENSGARITHEGKLYVLQPHVLYVLPAWIKFETKTVRRLAQNYIHFDVSGISPTLLQKFFSQPLRVASESWIDGLQQRWVDLQKNEPKPGLVRAALAGALVQAVMAILFSWLSPEEEAACFFWLEESGPVSPAIRCMELHLNAPPDNRELARQCGLSTSHFIRQFRLVVGMTPAEYGRERRVAIAARMLHNGRESIDEIAAATGFSDRFHFSRVFKSRLGVSPAKYRHMCSRPEGNQLSVPDCG